MITLVSENDQLLKQIAPEYDFDNPPVFSPRDKAFGLSDFVDSMMVTMQIKKGLGLAASQIGHNLRIFTMKIQDEEFVCINPVIKESSDALILHQEGCLSFPLLTLTISRPAEIFVSYQNVGGVSVQRWLNGTAARCFQHELDHLNGITFDTKAAALSLKLAKSKRIKVMKKQKRKK